MKLKVPRTVQLKPKRIIPVLILWAIFIYVIFNITYPESLAEISFFQFAAFFITFFAALTFTLNLFFKFLIFSAFLTLVASVLLIFKGLGVLNIFSFILTVISTALILNILKQYKRKFKSSKLTKKLI